MLVHGVGEEHDHRLGAVLERFREAGLTLRQEKCHLGKAEVKWFGMIFSEEGMSPDPKKTALIKNWPAPLTVRDIKSFLQTVQFNAAYLGAEEPGEMNYAELTAPLRELTRRKTKFTWTAKHQKHFQCIRTRLVSDKVMVPYDPTRDTRLYSDGGPEGAQATAGHPATGERNPTPSAQGDPAATTAAPTPQATGLGDPASPSTEDGTIGPLWRPDPATLDLPHHEKRGIKSEVV